MSEEEYLEKPAKKVKGKPEVVAEVVAEVEPEPELEASIPTDQVEAPPAIEAPSKMLAEASEDAVLASPEMRMLEEQAGSPMELERLRIITAQRENDMCEAEYDVEDLGLEIKDAERQLKEYSTKVTGRIAAWFIKLYTGMPVVDRLEKKLETLLDDQERAIKVFEAATDAWREAQDEESLQASINRTRKGGKL